MFAKINEKVVAKKFAVWKIKFFVFNFGGVIFVQQKSFMLSSKLNNVINKIAIIIIVIVIIIPVLHGGGTSL